MHTNTLTVIPQAEIHHPSPLEHPQLDWLGGMSKLVFEHQNTVEDTTFPVVHGDLPVSLSQTHDSCEGDPEVMLHAYINAKDFAMVELSLASMAKNQVVPSKTALTRLVDLYGKSGKLDRLDYVLQLAQSAGATPNITTFNALLRSYGLAKRLDRVEDLLDQMIQLGIQPNVRSFTHVIDACNKAG